MTREEKQLLLRDLCARLPYGVMCTDLRHGDSKITEVNTEDGLVYCPDFDEYVKVENCHLYLRPMSSMTEEEREYLQHHVNDDFVDYCNEHYLDYRGLNPMGLALEAPEGMYKTE